MMKPAMASMTWEPALASSTDHATLLKHWLSDSKSVNYISISITKEYFLLKGLKSKMHDFKIIPGSNYK